MTVIEDEYIWHDHQNLVSAAIRCSHQNAVEKESSDYDIVKNTASLSLDIGIVQDVRIINCFTKSSYTNLLSSFGISSFWIGSYFKFYTNGIGKHISLNFGDNSFADPKGLYANLSRLFINGRGIQSITSLTFRPFKDVKEHIPVGLANVEP